MAVNYISVIFLSALLTLSYSTVLKDIPTVQLLPNELVTKENSSKFIVYCFDNVPKSFLQIWRSVQLLLENAPSSSYEIFTGEEPSVVLQKSNEMSIWSPSSWFLAQKTTVEFPAFSPYCVGISSKEHYALFLKVRVVNYWKVLQMIVGIILFLSSPSLSRNSFFHYTSGISLGVIASLLILTYVVGRFIPRRSTSYAVMLFGYSFILYLLRVIWQHFNDIISNYMDVLLIYCLCAAFISFIVCYRLGPVQNVRTFNIIQYCMQTLACVLIYLGSEYREVSTALIIILVSLRIIPATWISRLQRTWYRFFPPKIRLLTEVEYIEQGNRETAKALDDLRKFCSSPDCNTWKMVRKLKEPLRFSKFVETGSHYTDEELLRYNAVDFDDDEEDDDDDDESKTPTYIRNGGSMSSEPNLSFR